MGGTTTGTSGTETPRPKGRPGRKPKGSVPVIVPETPDKPDPDHVLTWRQRKVLQVIRESVQRRGYPPSMREIGEAVGLTSTSSVSYQLSTLQKKGYLHRDVGRPRTVVLDEPVNGLDPDGVLWIRQLLKSLAEEGRTVFVSSHLMSEMAQTATRLVIVGRGKLIAETSVEEFIGHAETGDVLVRTPEAAGLSRALAGPGVTVTGDGTDVLRVSGATAEQVGAAAWRAHLPVYELTPAQASLEEAFMQVTHDSVEYHAGATR